MSNDLIANALTVDIAADGGTYTSTLIDNTTFGQEAYEPYAGVNGGWRTAWWRYTPLASGSATIDSTLTAYITSTDTYLRVYTGTPDTSVTGWGLTLVAQDDDSGGSGTSRLTYPLTAGTTYWIQLGAFTSSYTMSYKLTVVGPHSMAPPASIVVDIQTSATLNVAKPLASDLAVDIRLAQPDTVAAPAAQATGDAAAGVAESIAAPAAEVDAGTDPPSVVSRRTIAAPPAVMRDAALAPRLINPTDQPTPPGARPIPAAIWYLVAYRAGVPDGLISELQSAQGIKFTKGLDPANTPDQIEFAINGSSEDMALLGDPRGIDVVLMCNDDKVLRCRVQNNEGQAVGEGAHAVSYTAKAYTDYLGSFPLYDTDAAVDPGYTLVEAEEIGWDLVQVAMSRPYAKLGITRGADQATGILRTRTNLNWGDKISDVINKLGESNEVDDKSPGQFEWDIDPDLVYRVYPGGRGSHDPAFLFDSGGSARRFDYQYDLTSTVNAVVAQGQDFARAVVESADIASDPGGRCEMYVSADWVPAGPNNSSIEGYARWVLLQHGNVPQITIDASTTHWTIPADCWVGDFVALDLAEGYVTIKRSDLRVVGVQGTIADSGQAAVTFTVGRRFPGVFQAIDQLTKNPPTPPNPLPKGTNGTVLSYQNGWKALLPGSLSGFGGAHIFVQPTDPGAAANVGDLWFETSA